MIDMDGLQVEGSVQGLICSQKPLYCNKQHGGIKAATVGNLQGAASGLLHSERSQLSQQRLFNRLFNPGC